MKLAVQQSTFRTFKADAIALFISGDKAGFARDLAQLRKFLGVRLTHILEFENFKGLEGECCAFLSEKKLSSPKVFLVGLGDATKVSLERLRRAGAIAAKKARASAVRHLAFLPPDTTGFTAQPQDIASALAEGAILSGYKYDKYLSEKKKHKLSELTILVGGTENQKAIRHALHETQIISEATCFARDLENAPGSEIYPETLAASAKQSANKYGYRAVIWDKKKIEQMALGGLLAVSAGSNRPPRFIVLEHGAGRKDLDTIVLVGKGVTFDAGGISIKPASGMSEMKMDMSGAAAVMGTLEAATRLDLPIHVVGLIPATENLLGSSAMRPGDIIRHYGGKTSEVDNTDAEGRLILADALAYAETFKPEAVIDLATLTGACVVALGHHATGMMGTDDALMSRLKTAGEKTYERVWQLPLYDEYEKQIKSDVADVKNTGGRWGGAITAALFLKKFIGNYKWVHLDIAGTAILDEDLPYSPKGGSGVGVRLLIEFFKHWKEMPLP
jgi:leucyl aminopeptidase